MVGVRLPPGMLGAQQQQPVLGAGSPQPMLGGWQPGTTPQWVPDWLRNLSNQVTTGTQQSMQNISNLTQRIPGAGPMTPEDFRVLMSLGMNPEFTAYHGSPHTFDAFDASKIGTGEGAQAYGHGLYFAENPRVAEDYRTKLSDPSNKPIEGFDAAKLPSWVAARIQGGETPESMQNEFRGRIAEMQAGIDNGSDIQPWLTQDKIIGLNNIVDGLGAVASGAKINYTPGSFYKVDIQPTPDQFLDWDKPLSEQSPQVQSALSDLNIKPDQTGAQIHESSKLVSGQYRDPNAAAAELQRRGIPGIRYLDQGSRNNWIMRQHGDNFQPEDTMTGNTGPYYQTREDAQAFIDKKMAGSTHNYVVFDPQHIKILERNNQPIGPMLGAQPQLGK